MSLTTKLLAVLLVALAGVESAWASCALPDSATFDMVYPTQDQLEHYGDASVSFWVKIVGNTTQINSVPFSHGGNGETEATNYMYFIATNGSNTALRWLWESGGGTNSEFSVSGANLGTAGNLPNDVWMYFGFSRDSVDKDVDIYVWVEEKGGSTNAAPIEYTRTDSYTNNPSGGSSGTTQSMEDASGNQADTIAISNLQIYHRWLKQEEHDMIRATGQVLEGAVLHMPFRDCYDGVAIGQEGAITTDGTDSGVTAPYSEPGPPIAGLFR